MSKNFFFPFITISLSIFLILISPIQNYLILSFSSLDHRLPPVFHTTEGILCYWSKAEYATIIRAGTPPQEILMFIDFSDYYLSIISHSFHDSVIKTEFLSHLSTSYVEDTRKVFIINQRKVMPGKDSLYITSAKEDELIYSVCGKNGDVLVNPKKFDNIEFFYSPFFEEYSSTSGVIGFFYENKNQTIPSLNFLSQMEKAAELKTLTYSFSFNTINKGNLIIGSFPHIYDPNNFKKEQYIENKIIYNETENFRFKIKLQRAYFEYINNAGKKQNINVKEEGDNYLIINPDLYLIRVPDIYLQKLLATYFKEYFEKKICYIKSPHQNKIIACNKYSFTNDDLKKFPLLKIYVEDFQTTFEFNYEDVFRLHGNEYIFMMTNNLLSSNNNNKEFVFGKIILKKYRFTFNQSSKILGFYKPKGPALPKKFFFFMTLRGKITIAAVVVVIFCIIIFFVFKKKYENEKKNNRKLKKLRDEDSEIEEVSSENEESEAQELEDES